MRLIATIGYTTLAFAETADYAKIIEALSSAQQVEKNGYGSSAVWVPKKDAATTEIELRLEPLAKVAGEEAAELPLIAQLRRVTEERQELQSKVWALEGKVREFTKATEGLKTEAKATASDIPF